MSIVHDLSNHQIDSDSTATSIEIPQQTSDSLEIFDSVSSKRKYRGVAFALALPDDGTSAGRLAMRIKKQRRYERLGCHKNPKCCRYEGCSLLLLFLWERIATSSKQ